MTCTTYSNERKHISVGWLVSIGFRTTFGQKGQEKGRNKGQFKNFEVKFLKNVGTNG